MPIFKVNFVKKYPTLEKLLAPYLIEGAEEIAILPSNGYPWNAWIVVYSSDGKRILSTFSTGLYWELMEVLKNIRGFKTIAKAQLKLIGREWKKVTV